MYEFSYVWKKYIYLSAVLKFALFKKNQNEPKKSNATHNQQ